MQANKIENWKNEIRDHVIKAAISTNRKNDMTVGQGLKVRHCGLTATTQTVLLSLLPGDTETMLATFLVFHHQQ